MPVKKLGCRTCRHIMPTGCPCQSPAKRESAYCYFHARLHGPSQRVPQPQIALELPPIDSPRAIRESVSIICNLLLARKIHPRQAGRILYGLQLAATQFRHE